jgi:hypothetical protein
MATSLHFPRMDANDAARGDRRAHFLMFRSVVDRAWHLAVTVGPIVVIALALVAARRW